MKDEWAAYCLDSAAGVIGNYVESKLAENDEKGKPKHTLKQILAFEKPSSLLDNIRASAKGIASFVREVKGK